MRTFFPFRSASALSWPELLTIPFRVTSYVEAEEAADLELTSFSNSTVTLSMDRASKLSENEARDSVRLSSKEVIQPGSLLVIDLNHIPTG